MREERTATAPSRDGKSCRCIENDLQTKVLITHLPLSPRNLRFRRQWLSNTQSRVSASPRRPPRPRATTCVFTTRTLEVSVNWGSTEFGAREDQKGEGHGVQIGWRFTGRTLKRGEGCVQSSLALSVRPKCSTRNEGEERAGNMMSSWACRRQ